MGDFDISEALHPEAIGTDAASNSSKSQSQLRDAMCFDVFAETCGNVQTVFASICRDAG